MPALQVPVHPGEVLKELYLAPLGMSEGKLAKALRVPRTRIERLCREETSVTTDTAFRLAKAFGTTPEYWINMQTNFELTKAAGSIDVSDVQELRVA